MHTGGGTGGRGYLDYLQQLVTVNAAAAINVIEFEVPAELLLHSPLQHQTQSSHILHEVNEPVLQGEAEGVMLLLKEELLLGCPFC